MKYFNFDKSGKTILLEKIRNGVCVNSLSCKRNDCFSLELMIPRGLGITDVSIDFQGRKEKFIWNNLYKEFDVYIYNLSEYISNIKKHFIFNIELKSTDEILYPKSFSQGIIDKKSVYYLTDKFEESHCFLFTVNEKSEAYLFKGAVYHIFIDRFNKVSPSIRSDSEFNDDWENGIPEFSQIPGEFLKNNTHFGGTFEGIEEKLDYLESLSVECIYLSPLNKAFSNHKYDVGSYFQIDENFGGEEKLKHLIKSCHERKIKVIFDSVFNHTGDNSEYFNKFGTYNSVGAFQSLKSDYYDWYTFSKYPYEYDAWWGIKCLPAIKKGNQNFMDFVCKKGGVIDFYMELGADGLRLDVADELTVKFIEEIKKAVKRNNREALLIGEVWENAARKIAWNEEKFYFDTGRLDSVTNYPLLKSILDCIKNCDTSPLIKTISELYTDYPEENAFRLFNILSTHDTFRAISFLGATPPKAKKERAVYKMDEQQYGSSLKKMKLASALQTMLPGTPCIYYGDEIGMEGLEDPFNRLPMKWASPANELLEWYRILLKTRKQNRSLYEGDLKIKYYTKTLFVFDREKSGERIRTFINLSDEKITFENSLSRDLISGEYSNKFCVEPMDCKIIKFQDFENILPRS